MLEELKKILETKPHTIEIFFGSTTNFRAVDAEISLGESFYGEETLSIHATGAEFNLDIRQIRSVSGNNPGELLIFI